LRAEGGILLALGEQFQRGKNGQAGADERQKLLIEDQEGFQLDALASAGTASQAGRTE
jgi:hypothetical protein